jgi:Short-chain dehydrogenases of various substrate specificities
VVVPGSVFVEMVLCAAGRVGCDGVRELTFQAPLVLSGAGAVDVSVVVAAAGSGQQPELVRGVSVYSRPADADGDGQWVLHAQGVLGAGAGCAVPVDAGELAGWPVAGAEVVGLAGGYEELAVRGYGYGPAFRGVRGLWRRGGEVFVEVGVAGGGVDVTGFGVHPALLDAVVHSALLVPGGGLLGDGDGEKVSLPFAWEGVRWFAPGGSVLRARVASVGESGAVSVVVVDEVGRLVLSAESFRTRPVSRRQLGGVGGSEGLWEVVWSPVVVSRAGVSEQAVVSWSDVAGGGGAVSGVVVAEVGGGGDVVAGAGGVVGDVLVTVQAWVSQERFASAVLVVVTRGAVALPGEGVVDVAASGVWGLVRSAQLEHPGRFVLVDAGVGVDVAGLARQVVGLGEPQLVVRSGVVYAARLAGVSAGSGGGFGGVRGGTVLVTGGTGGLGAVVARWLVRGCGVGRLVLVSRRGLAAAGALELRRELSVGGVRVDVVACDVSDRDAVWGLVAGLGDLAGVVHAAGVLDDGVVESLSVERLDAVWGVKAAGAWFLHEATRGLDLRLFVLFSSIAGTVGGAGQASYAAANTFLDGLAAYRRAGGLPAVSVAWGPWAGGGMAERLGEADAARLAREGVRALTPEQGLALLEAAAGHPRPQLVAVRWDMAVLRSRARAGSLPSLLTGLVPAVRPAATAGPDPATGLRERLTGLTETDQQRIVLDIVLRQIATVLGHSSGDHIDPDDPFEKQGLDSLGAVQIRNHLATATGLSLSMTAIYDYPTPATLAVHLHQRIVPETPQTTGTELPMQDIRRLLRSARPTRPGDSDLVQALLNLAETHGSLGGTTASAKQKAIREMDAGDLIAMGLGFAKNRRDDAE